MIVGLLKNFVKARRRTQDAGKNVSKKGYMETTMKASELS